MEETSIPKHPLQRIALTLSGGGYRAAAFHLGTLSYLHKIKFQGKPLLEYVKVISTVSGGTFTGMLYSGYICQGKTFEDCYRKLYSFMHATDMIKESLAMLEDSEDWNSLKSRNLINSFARIYQDKLFNELPQKHFEIYRDINKYSHLDEVIFNATEFRYGISFRFQNKGLFGNRKIVSREDWEKMPLQTNAAAISNELEKVRARYQDLKNASWEIRLGDILAASSCFPAGFEPICFPDDFVYPEATNLKTLKDKKYFSNTIGLMDGGIVDNEGINSVLLSEKRNKHQPIDLIIISDVSSPFMKPYKVSKEKIDPFWGELSISRLSHLYSNLNTFMLAVQVVALLSIGYLLLSATTIIPLHMLGACLASLLVGASTATLIIHKYLKSYIQSNLSKFYRYILEKVPAFYHPYIPYFTKLKFKVLWPMLLNRYNSVLTMVSEVFMKQVRRLIYNRVYEDKYWKFRRLTNFIYDLKAKNPIRKEYLGGVRDTGSVPLQEIRPNKKIKETAEFASGMGTTLWFTEADRNSQMLNHIIACGQFTVCFNLLSYLGSLLNQTSPGMEHVDNQTIKALIALQKEMLNDWEKFSDEPMYVVNELNSSLQLNEDGGLK